MSGRVRPVDLGALSLPLGVFDADIACTARPAAELLAQGLRLQRLLGNAADFTRGRIDTQDGAGAANGVIDAAALDLGQMKALQACLESAARKALELRDISDSVTLQLKESVLSNAVLAVRSKGPEVRFDLCVRRSEDWRALSEVLESLARAVSMALGRPVVVSLNSPLDGYRSSSSKLTAGDIA